MKCPKCKKEMSKGIIGGGLPPFILWNERNTINPLELIFGWKRLMLNKRGNICHRCRVITFKY